LELKRYKEAEVAFEDCSISLKGDIRPHVGLASIATRMEDWPMAVKRWRFCLTGFAEHEEACAWRLELAQALWHSGDIAGAENELRTVLRIKPDDVGVRENLACMAAEQGQFKVAADVFQSCLADYPNHSKSARWRAGLASAMEGMGEATLSLE
jgi:hypothetical protein